MGHPFSPNILIHRELLLDEELNRILYTYGFDSIKFDGTTPVSRDRIKVSAEQPDWDKPVNDYLFLVMRVKLNSLFREMQCINYPNGSSDDENFDLLWREEDYQEKDFDPAEWANILHLL